MNEFEVITGGVAEEPGAGGCKRCGVGCLGFLILGAIVLGVTSANASARLDARFAQASQEIAGLQDAADVRRSTIVGAPPNDEDAVVDYNGLEWVLTSGKGANRRNSWNTQRPGLPEGIDAMVGRVNPEGKEIDLIVLPSTLLAGIDPDHKVKDTPAWRARRKKAEALFKRLRPALRYVRDGLSRGKCNWEIQWARGMRYELPNLIAMRAAATLMVYEASLQPPAEAIQTGLEIVAFGEDLGRQETMIGGMIGIAVSAIGFQSLTHTLGRPGCEAGDYQRVIAALEGYRAPPAGSLFFSEQLVGVVSALELSGRPMEEAGSEGLGYEASAIERLLFALSVLQAREIDGYEHFMERGVEISRLPQNQREAAWDEWGRDLESSSYLVIKVAMPNLRSVQDNLSEAEALARIVRVLAAAHLMRLEEGAFPSSIQGVARVLGKGIEDPCSGRVGAPLLYALEGEKLYCWTVGGDKADNGGVKSWESKSPAPASTSDDRGLATQAPGE